MGDLQAIRVSGGALAACFFAIFLGSASPASGVTIQVPAGGNLQAAINAAQPGDVIVLPAGARFVGAFNLPAKPIGPVIVIRSSATLPNRRLTPADAPLLPTIASSGGAPAITGHGARGWTLQGIRFEANVAGANNVVELLDAVQITLDRILLVAPPTGQRRAIMGNGNHITLTRSHIAGIWAPTLQDSQCFMAYDGAGPYTITDNYCEAASENVMFGGPDSRSADRIPSDILVEGNHFSKPLEWKGLPRAVKNLFELKSARRVVIRNNLFDRNWTDAQNGFAILFTVRSDVGGAPWSVVEDVLFEYNIIRDTEGVFNILGRDMYKPTGRTTRITIRHNLAIGSGTFLLAGGEVGVLTLDHNTVDQGGTFAMLLRGNVWEPGQPAPRPALFAVEALTITNTIGNHSSYGVFGEGGFIGTAGLTNLTRSYRWTNNVLAGGEGLNYSYPTVTWRVSTAEHRAQFTGVYQLVATSRYRNAATDGQDLGMVRQGVLLWPARAPRAAPIMRR